MKIRCVSLDGDLVAGLTLDKIYDVIEFDGNMVRIINDFEEPPLYESQLFEVVDPTIPDDWVTLVDKYCTISYGPELFAISGFWERCWDKELPEFEQYRDWLARNSIPFRGWKTDRSATIGRAKIK